MMRSLVLPLVAINSIVNAQDWNSWDSTVTKTVTRTHTYCPCETSLTWASWTGISLPTSSTTSTYTSTTSSSNSSNSVSVTVTSTGTSTSPSSSSSSLSTTTSSSSTTTASSSTTTTTTTPLSTTTTITTSSSTTTISTSSSTTTTSAFSTTTTPAGCSSGISEADKTRVQGAFTSSGIVPTLIASINPAVVVNVNYNGKAVDLGTEFITSETLTAPTLTFSAEPASNADITTYSYFLIDPDVPSPQSPVRTTFLHWLVSGAKSTCATSQTPSTVAIYQPLTPASTTQHRYTFLVYREPANYTPDAVTPQVRTGFDVNAYAAKAGLVLVGGNYLLEGITNGIISTTAVATSTSSSAPPAGST